METIIMGYIRERGWDIWDRKLRALDKEFIKGKRVLSKLGT